MIRAAATGRLDYKDADSDDSIWLLRERMMISYSEREALVDLLKQRQLQQVATAVWPAGDTAGEAWQAHYDSGRDHLLTIGGLLFPWLSWDEKDRYKSEIDELRAEYKAKFGDPSTPEAKEQDKRNKESIKRRQLDAEQQATQKLTTEHELAVSMKRIREKRYRKRT